MTLRSRQRLNGDGESASRAPYGKDARSVPELVLLAARVEMALELAVGTGADGINWA
jgi:hypothetical protein